jgi:hypothetical protein
VGNALYIFKYAVKYSKNKRGGERMHGGLAVLPLLYYTQPL